MSVTPQPTSPQAESHEIRQLLAELSLRVARVEQRLGIESTPVRAEPPLDARPVEPPRPPNRDVGVPPATAPPTATIPSVAAPVLSTPAPIAPISPAAPPQAAPFPAVPLPAVPLPAVTMPAVPPASNRFQFENYAAPPTVAEDEQSTRAQAEMPSPARSSSITLDWENLIGGKWALWIGSISMFLAIASFLAYTWRFMPPPPPAAKVTMGIAAGVAALVAGAYFRERTQRWFSEGLFGVGLGILYLSIWTAAQSFHLISFSTAFVSLGLITTAGVYLSVRYDAVSLITLATIGGFLTPLLLQSDGQPGSVTPFLVYVAVLNAGIVAVSLFKKWRGIVWLSFVATILLVGGWAADAYTVEYRWTTFAFVTLYFLLFLGASCFYSFVHREQTAHQDLLLLFADASLYAVLGFALVHDSLGDYPGLFPVALALFFALLSRTVRLLAPDNITLRYSAGGLALLSLTVAVPIQLEQEWLAIGWNVEAGVLLVLSCRLRGPLLQRAGQIVWALSLCALLPVTSEARPALRILFINNAALPILASVVTASIVTATLVVLRNQKSDWKDQLAACYAAYAVFAGAWLIAHETKLAFALWFTNEAHGWRTEGAFVVACLWSVFALAIFITGLRCRHLVLRATALCVAAIAATLPLWFGTTLVNSDWTPFWNLRWLAYVVTGATLVMLGWMISREKSVLESDEVETLSYWPAGTVLFLLAGMTTEVYLGFSPEPGYWPTTALFAVAILWSVYAVMALLLGYAWRQPVLRGAAYWIGAVGCLLLLLNACAADVTYAPLLNLRFVAFTIVLATLSAASYISNSQKAARTEDEDWVLSGIRLLSTLVLVWGLTQEVYESCQYFKTALGTHWQLFAFFLITMLWHGLSGGLWSVGLRLSKVEQRFTGYALGTLSGVFLLHSASEAWQIGWLPLVNVRFIAFVTAAATLATVTVALRRHRASVSEHERALVMYLGLTAALVLLWGLTQESHETCYYFRTALGAHWDRWAQMTISLVWSLYGALLLIGGISRRHQPVRLTGLGLLGLTILKVFLFDLSFLDASLRMLSLAGLGAALIFISWLYSRFGVEGAKVNA